MRTQAGGPAEGPPVERHTLCTNDGPQGSGSEASASATLTTDPAAAALPAASRRHGTGEKKRERVCVCVKGAYPHPPLPSDTHTLPHAHAQSTEEEEVLDEEPTCCGLLPGGKRMQKKEKDAITVSMADPQHLGDEANSCCNLVLLRQGGPAGTESAVAMRGCPGVACHNYSHRCSSFLILAPRLRPA